MHLLCDIYVARAFADAHATEGGCHTGHRSLHGLERQLEGLRLIGQGAALLALCPKLLPCLFERAHRHVRRLQVIRRSHGHRLNRGEILVVLAELVLRVNIDLGDGDLQDLLHPHVRVSDGV